MKTILTHITSIFCSQVTAESMTCKNKIADLISKRVSCGVCIDDLISDQYVGKILVKYLLCDKRDFNIQNNVINISNTVQKTTFLQDIANDLDLYEYSNHYTTINGLDGFVPILFYKR